MIFVLKMLLVARAGLGVSALLDSYSRKERLTRSVNVARKLIQKYTVLQVRKNYAIKNGGRPRG